MRVVQLVKALWDPSGWGKLFLLRQDCNMGCLCRDTVVHLACFLQNKLLVWIDGTKELLHLLSFTVTHALRCKSKRVCFFLVISGGRRIDYPLNSRYLVHLVFYHQFMLAVDLPGDASYIVLSLYYELNQPVIANTKTQSWFSESPCKHCSEECELFCHAWLLVIKSSSLLAFTSGDGWNLCKRFQVSIWLQ